MPRNIDAFNLSAALILALLYAQFPVSAMLTLSEIDEALADRDEIAAMAEFDVLRSTVESLVRDGIVHGGITSDGIDSLCELVLTAKGLEVLQSTPGVMKSKQLLGTQIGTAVKSGARETFNSLISAVISGVVGAQMTAHGLAT